MRAHIYIYIYVKITFRDVGTASSMFSINQYAPTGWTHVVLNYLGPNTGEGVRLFYDAIEVKGHSVFIFYLNPPDHNRIVVGRMYTDENERYTSIQIDELRFFNQNLTLEEIGLLYYQDK